MPLFEAIDVSKTVGGRQVLKGLSFSFQAGRMYGIIGPNGVGKSTLLQLLSGAASPTEGQIRLEGERVDAIPRRRLARKLAVLQQGGLPAAGFTVEEAVAMGRYPYQNWLGDEPKDASPLVDAAIRAMGLDGLRGRTLDRLSGGERQRAALAKVIVQEAGVILLDEPTTFLDIGYQLQLMDTVRRWQRERELTVIAVLHELNLAALYCDELLMLHEGGIAAFGEPEQVMTAELIERVYGTRTAIIRHPECGKPQMMLVPGHAGNNAGKADITAAEVPAEVHG